MAREGIVLTDAQIAALEKKAISRFCCRSILAGKGKAVAHPEPEFLHGRPEASGMATIVKNRSINFVIEP